MLDFVDFWLYIKHYILEANDHKNMFTRPVFVLIPNVYSYWSENDILKTVGIFALVDMKNPVVKSN